MRIFIITQDEPVYAPLYLEKIIQQVKHPIVGVTALSPSGNKGWISFAKQRLGMYGLWDFFRASLMYMSFRLKNIFFGNGKGNRFYSITRLSKHYLIPLFPCTNVNDPEYIKQLRDQNIGILISVAANQIFRKKLIQTPNIACLNIHSSLLPKYRGLDALFWALVNGETQVGVTVHLVNEKIDDGDIVAQKPFDVAPENSLHKLYYKAMGVGAKLLSEVLDQYEKDSVRTKKNDITLGSSYSWPTAEAARQFRKNGKKFF